MLLKNVKRFSVRKVERYRFALVAFVASSARVALSDKETVRDYEVCEKCRPV